MNIVISSLSIHPCSGERVEREYIWRRAQKRAWPCRELGHQSKPQIVYLYAPIVSSIEDYDVDSLFIDTNGIVSRRLWYCISKHRVGVSHTTVTCRPCISNKRLVVHSPPQPFQVFRLGGRVGGWGVNRLSFPGGQHCVRAVPISSPFAACHQPSVESGTQPLDTFTT